MATHTDVDQALRQVDDWPLQAEVQYYRSTTQELDNYYQQMLQLCQSITTAMSNIKQSIWWLLQSNMYQ